MRLGNFFWRLGTFFGSDQFLPSNELLNITYGLVNFPKTGGKSSKPFGNFFWSLKPILPHYLANSNFHRENSKGNYTLKPISTHCEAMAVYYEQRSNVMIISWRDFTWLFLDLRNTRFLMTLAGDVINKKIRKYLTDFTYSFTTALSLPLAGAVLNYDLTTWSTWMENKNEEKYIIDLTSATLLWSLVYKGVLRLNLSLEFS